MFLRTHFGLKNTIFFSPLVIKIAGDALLVLFRVDATYQKKISSLIVSRAPNVMVTMKYLHSSPNSAVSESVKCALQCVELSKVYNLSSTSTQTEKTGTKNRLTLHCGISYGKLFDVICGGKSYKGKRT